MLLMNGAGLALHNHSFCKFDLTISDEETKSMIARSKIGLDSF